MIYSTNDSIFFVIIVVSSYSSTYWTLIDRLVDHKSTPLTNSRQLSHTTISFSDPLYIQQRDMTEAYFSIKMVEEMR